MCTELDTFVVCLPVEAVTSTSANMPYGRMGAPLSGVVGRSSGRRRLDFVAHDRPELPDPRGCPWQRATAPGRSDRGPLLVAVLVRPSAGDVLARLSQAC